MVECFPGVVKKAVEEQTKDYLMQGETLAVTYGACEAVLKHVFGPAHFRFPATKAARQDTLMDLRAGFGDKNPTHPEMALPHTGCKQRRSVSVSLACDMSGAGGVRRSRDRRSARRIDRSERRWRKMLMTRC